MKVVKEIDELEIKDEDGTISVKRGSVSDLAVKNGDVIVLRRQPGLSAEVIDSLADRLGELGYGRCVLVVVNKMSDIKALDEDMMRKYGWVRYGA